MTRCANERTPSSARSRTLKEQTSHLDVLRAREQDLERELAAVAQRLGASAGKQSLPTLDQVRVASPCNASWDEMLGDERVRFCVSCEKNVYNLSAMPREDAERLLQERIGKELCVRFYQRADGTILTEDCPVGVKKKRRKKLALAVAGAGAMAFAATSMLSLRTTQGSPVMGGMAAPKRWTRSIRSRPRLRSGAGVRATAPSSRRRRRRRPRRLRSKAGQPALPPSCRRPLGWER